MTDTPKKDGPMSKHDSSCACDACLWPNGRPVTAGTVDARGSAEPSQEGSVAPTVSATPATGEAKPYTDGPLCCREAVAEHEATKRKESPDDKR